MRQRSHQRRSRGLATERLTVRGLVGSLGVFGVLLAALSAPVLVAGAIGVAVAAAVVGKAVYTLRERVPGARSRLQLHVPLTDLSVRI